MFAQQDHPFVIRALFAATSLCRGFRWKSLGCERLQKCFRGFPGLIVMRSYIRRILVVAGPRYRCYIVYVTGLTRDLLRKTGRSTDTQGPKGRDDWS